MSLILRMSSFWTSSSIESITIPKLEYSRMDLTSRTLARLSAKGPVMMKATILRDSGSTISSETLPMLLEACMLRIGVPINLELVINIVLL